MPFAGHPTLGSCHAWLQAGGVPKNGDAIVQECQVGLVRVRRSGSELAFAAPVLQRSAPAAEVVARLASALGIGVEQVLAAQALNNGPRHFGLLLDDPDTVLAITPDLAALRAWCQDTGHSGVGFAARYATDSGSALIKRSNREARAFEATPAPEADAIDLEVRFFANDVQVSEDPITGSFNASLAQWLIADGHMPSSYTAAQGRCIGRAGRVAIARDAQGQVWVGGNTVNCISGIVAL